MKLLKPLSCIQNIYLHISQIEASKIFTFLKYFKYNYNFYNNKNILFQHLYSI